MLKVSLIGVGRRRNGIGEYLAKYFHKNGARVISHLGTSEEASQRASSVLTKYGIEARPFADFKEMVSHERPDAIVIASPSTTHQGYLLKSVESGFHVFCEKPFVWDEKDDLERMTEDILKRARAKKLTVGMNSQWAFALKDYEEMCGKLEFGRSSQFFIHLSPHCSGLDMIPESVPHALSLLYTALGGGEIARLHFEEIRNGEMTITFTYQARANECGVIIRLVTEKTQPRPFAFGFNGRIVTRRIDVSTYELYFCYGDRHVKIVDPVDLSIRNFIEAVERHIDPLVGMGHIVNNMVLLKRVVEGYREVGRRQGGETKRERTRFQH